MTSTEVRMTVGTRTAQPASKRPSTWPPCEHKAPNATWTIRLKVRRGNLVKSGTFVTRDYRTSASVVPVAPDDGAGRWVVSFDKGHGVQLHHRPRGTELLVDDVQIDGRELTVVGGAGLVALRATAKRPRTGGGVIVGDDPGRWTPLGRSQPPAVVRSAAGSYDLGLVRGRCGQPTTSGLVCPPLRRRSAPARPCVHVNKRSCSAEADLLVARCRSHRAHRVSSDGERAVQRTWADVGGPGQSPRDTTDHRRADRRRSLQCRRRSRSGTADRQEGWVRHPSIGRRRWRGHLAVGSDCPRLPQPAPLRGRRRPSRGDGAPLERGVPADSLPSAIPPRRTRSTGPAPTPVHVHPTGRPRRRGGVRELRRQEHRRQSQGNLRRAAATGHRARAVLDRGRPDPPGARGDDPAAALLTPLDGDAPSREVPGQQQQLPVLLPQAARTGLSADLARHAAEEDRQRRPADQLVAALSLPDDTRAGVLELPARPEPVRRADTAGVLRLRG